MATVSMVVGSTAAHAATSHQLSDGSNGKIFGEAWFNAGTHRLDIGRNSFTLKDRSCHDGYRAVVEWRGARTGTRTHVPDCGEESFSIEPRNVAWGNIEWHVCRVDIYTGIGACENTWVPDHVD